MSIKKEDILALVSDYIEEKHSLKKWTPGVDWVQYSGPYFDSNEFVAAVNTLLNEWLVLGEDAIKFEKQFPPLLGKEYGVFVNSGSSANLLMVLTAKKYYKWKDKDKIIVPVAGFPTTVNPIIQANLTPVFVDIELDTLNLDLDQVEKAAENGAKGIIFAHVLGNPPNMNRIMEIVNQYNLILLEDCCDALGSTYKNQLLGSFGRSSTCSMYPAHHITCGQGGFVAFDTIEEKRIAESYRTWGRSCYCCGKKANLSMKGTCGCRFSRWISELPDEIFDHKYIYDNIGYNLQPIESQASIGLEQIKKLPEIHKKRKENHKRLIEIFTPYEKYFHIHKATPNSNPSWFAFPITLKDNVPFKRSMFISFLEDNKIQTRCYFGGNLLLQPAYQKIQWVDINRTAYGYSDGIAKSSFPIATKITTDTLFLGTSPVITSEQLNYVKYITDEFFKNI